MSFAVCSSITSVVIVSSFISYALMAFSVLSSYYYPYTDLNILQIRCLLICTRFLFCLLKEGLGHRLAPTACYLCSRSDQAAFAVLAHSGDARLVHGSSKKD